MARRADHEGGFVILHELDKIGHSIPWCSCAVEVDLFVARYPQVRKVHAYLIPPFPKPHAAALAFHSCNSYFVQLHLSASLGSARTAQTLRQEHSIAARPLHLARRADSVSACQILVTCNQ
jgi:hypothetical protein